MESIDQLASEIAACRRREQIGLSVRHAPIMNRGTGREILVVGIEPGNTELQSGEAFSPSGLAGRRLVGWLIQAGIGNSRAEILKRTHMTSLCKCNIEKKSELSRAAANCFPYLEKQIALLRPRVVVTVGVEPLKMLVRGTC